MSILGVGLYVKNSVKAVEIYKSAFNLELGYHVLNKDGSYFHSELYKDGKETFSVVESSEEPEKNNPVQLCFTFEERDKLIHAFNVLSKNGRVDMEIQELPWSPCAAEVVDRFGIRWYLTLMQHRPADDFTPDDM